MAKCCCAECNSAELHIADFCSWKCSSSKCSESDVMITKYFQKLFCFKNHKCVKIPSVVQLNVMAPFTALIIYFEISIF
jgi:hypothetical protein